MVTETCLVSQASAKERFDLLYARLKSIHDVFIDVVFKATAFFLLVTGWIITSEVALKHLQCDRASLWLGIACLAVYACLYLLAAYRTARSSQLVLGRLKEINYLSPLDYSDVFVPKSVALTFGIANALLCAAVAVFIYRAAT